MLNKAIFNRAPLSRNELAALPVGAIRPRGWLKEQLETAANGLTGKLADFWPSVRDSAWCGGSGDSWERAPYYLDGLVPLAWILDDQYLKDVALRYINWTLASQREDGFFGPADNEDWWPRMVMLKALISYYSATADARVPEFMFRYFKYQYRMLDEKPLSDWAVPRGAENIESVIWLYNLTGAEFLLSLMKKLRAQTLDWTGHFNAFPYTRSMSELLPWEDLKKGLAEEHTVLSGKNRPYYATQYHLSHVVNTAMGLRAGAIMSQFTGSARDREAFETGYEKLMRYHGVASGMFNGDEHLSGNSPTQGTELCAVVETMYTCELLPTTGANWTSAGDLMEKLAFNALPAAMSGDMMAHQYDQQVNQLRCTAENHGWYNNADDSNLFGLEPNYGCCTANLHQGWPKYVASLWYACRDGGFYAMSYAPCAVSFFSEGMRVRIEVETNYPFDRFVRIRVSPDLPKTFALRLRVPRWANGVMGVMLNGEEFEGSRDESMVEIKRRWRRGDELTLVLPMEPRQTHWSRRSVAVEYGPLLMAAPVNGEEHVVRPDPNAPDYEVRPVQDDWNCGLVEGGKLDYDLSERTYCFGKGEGLPALLVEAAQLPDWKMKGGNCAPTPVDPKLAESYTRTLRLVPYGDTVLRVAQFPLVKLEKNLGPDPSVKVEDADIQAAVAATPREELRALKPTVSSRVDLFGRPKK